MRVEAHLTQRGLAERSGVSARYLSQLESGDANISVGRLDDVARALGTSLPALFSSVALAGEPSPAGRNVIALIGLRGAGKSTIGRRLAETLAFRFVELDRLIEEAAGLTLSEIFELHGETYYRRLERETLAALLQADQGVVVATGGSLVSDRETYKLLKRGATTVWLRADAEDHWNRVLKQGDQRPMAEHPHAMAELRALLAAREGLYAEAEHRIDTSALSVEAAVDELAGRLRPAA
jgi:XRE family aerobic/anaerobic benzoate catabolism transcriptional regulator